MRIGVDLSCWTNHRGYGRYCRNLLSALMALDQQHTYIGFADSGTLVQGTFPPRLQLVSIPQSEPPAQAAAAHGRRKLADIWRMSRAASHAGLDIMFFPASYTYFPVLGRTRCVVVVHDAIAERWPRLIFPTLAGRLAWTVKSHLACRLASRVVTVSHAAARAIRQYLHVPADRLRVIYEAADPVFAVRDSAADHRRRRQILERYALPPNKQLLLYVGGFSPHKNLETLLAAFAQLAASAPPRSTVAAPEDQDEMRAGAHVPLHLVLTGETSREVFYSCYAALQEQVSQLHLEQHVTFTGYVPDDDLVHLYQAATCLVLPSHDEGFGLPVVEAMACGTPVMASSAGALPELVGDAGLLAAPDQTEAFVVALRRLVSDPTLQADLRERGLQRAAQFTWERAAACLLAVFDELSPDLPDGYREQSGRGSRIGRGAEQHA